MMWEGGKGEKGGGREGKGGERKDEWEPRAIKVGGGNWNSLERFAESGSRFSHANLPCLSGKRRRPERDRFDESLVS